MAKFKLGFAAYAAVHPEVGEPLEDEHYLAGDDAFSIQPTSTGMLWYNKGSNTVAFYPKGTA